MPTLTKAQVSHIAALARLQLTPQEEEKMAKELSSILQYVDILGELDTTDVQPTAQVTGLSSVLRSDSVATPQSDPTALMACSPLPLVERQIEVPHAHG